jgi:hypothetical protein
VTARSHLPAAVGDANPLTLAHHCSQHEAIQTKKQVKVRREVAHSGTAQEADWQCTSQDCGSTALPGMQCIMYSSSAPGSNGTAPSTITLPASLQSPRYQYCAGANYRKRINHGVQLVTTVSGYSCQLLPCSTGKQQCRQQCRCLEHKATFTLPATDIWHSRF